MQSNRIKRSAFLSALLIIIMLLSALPILASDAEPPKVDGGSAIVLYDKTHGKYIVEEEGDALVNTSTSAKITMGLVACEALENRLDETVTVTESMLSGVSGNDMKPKLQDGEKIKIRDLLYAAITWSANDAAYVLSYVVGEDVHGFVDMMNIRARKAGAKNTNYVNPLGYPDNSAMLTTAYDTLKIALAASENPLYMEICSAAKYTVKATNLSGERTHSNKNLLVAGTDKRYDNPAYLGMNAGYSGEVGGWSIVTLIRDKDKDGTAVDYVCVLLGGKENEDGSEIYAYDSVNILADWVCDTYNNYKIFPKDTQLGTTKVELSMEDKAPYIVAEDLSVYIPTKSTENDLSYYVTLNDDIRAPIEAGTVVGKVIVTSKGEKIGECDLLLKKSYEVNGVMKVIDDIGSYTKSRAFIATIICFIVLLAAVLIYRYFNRFNSHGKYTRKR